MRYYITYSKSPRSKCGKMIASGSTLRKNRFGDSGASHTASSVRTCVTPCSELATPRASPHAAAACATARAFDSSAMWAAPHEHAQTTLGASELSSERGSSSDQKESELHLESTMSAAACTSPCCGTRHHRESSPTACQPTLAVSDATLGAISGRKTAW